MIDLSGRRVLVTGGSRGIGAACCRAFAAAGASVAIHYRADESAARAVEKVCRAAGEGEHLVIAADLAAPDGLEELFGPLESAWEGLDCVVNNAGIWVHNPLSEYDDRRAAETWELNVAAVFRVTARAAPWLERAEDGNVVSISSTAGQRGEAEYSPYAASKGALIAATKSWSTELAPGVRVNAVAPGWVDTDMCTEVFADGGRERIESTIPLRRVGSVEDIAGPVLFLASPLARHVTGEILNVNGGAVLAG